MTHTPPDADGYYGDDSSNVEELDLSFLDEPDTKDAPDDTSK